MSRKFSNKFDYVENQSAYLDSSFDSSLITESSFSSDSSFVSSVSTDQRSSLIDSFHEITAAFNSEISKRDEGQD